MPSAQVSSIPFVARPRRAHAGVLHLLHLLHLRRCSVRDRRMVELTVCCLSVVRTDVVREGTWGCSGRVPYLNLKWIQNTSLSIPSCPEKKFQPIIGQPPPPDPLLPTALPQPSTLGHFACNLEDKWLFVCVFLRLESNHKRGVKPQKRTHSNPHLGCAVWDGTAFGFWSGEAPMEQKGRPKA